MQTREYTSITCPHAIYSSIRMYNKHPSRKHEYGRTSKELNYDPDPDPEDAVRAFGAYTEDEKEDF